MYQCSNFLNILIPTSAKTEAEEEYYLIENAITKA